VTYGDDLQAFACSENSRSSEVHHGPRIFANNFDLRVCDRRFTGVKQLPNSSKFGPGRKTFIWPLH